MDYTDLYQPVTDPQLARTRAPQASKGALQKQMLAEATDDWSEIDEGSGVQTRALSLARVKKLVIRFDCRTGIITHIKRATPNDERVVVI